MATAGRGISRERVPIDWGRIRRRAGIGALILLVVANLLADAAKVAQVAHLGLIPAINSVGFDWTLLSRASEVMVAGGDPYAGSAFKWTPVAALAFYPLSLLGWHLWQLAHLGAALAMPSWRMRLVVLLAFPFWWDLELGNILVFVLLAAIWALRGNQLGIGAFLALTVLVPRPLMVPIALWLLWKHPQWRLPFAAMGIGVIVATGATGLLGEFAARILEAGEQIHHGYNFAPSQVVGPAWLLIAVPLAAWLTWRRRLGLASVVASPYWLPYYLLLGLVDADSDPRRTPTPRTRAPRSTARRPPDPGASGSALRPDAAPR
jgi:hypothetical protein